MRISPRITLSLLAAMTMLGGLMAVPRHGAAANGATPSLSRSVTVTEEEPIAAQGQGAMLQLGLQTQAADSRSAQSDAQQALDRLRQGLRAAGIPTANVRVMGYRIGASTGGQTSGTTVWQNLQVLVESQDKLGSAIDAAVASGATVVQGFMGQGAAPSASERALAVANAVRSARSDARAIAQALGERLGRSTSVEVHMQRGTPAGGAYVMTVRVTFSG